MCGVVGILSTQKQVAGELYESLIHLQHRGQDAAGMMTYNKRFHEKRGLGTSVIFLMNETWRVYKVRLGLGTHDILPLGVSVLKKHNQL